MSENKKLKEMINNLSQVMTDKTGDIKEKVTNSSKTVSNQLTDASKDFGMLNTVLERQ